jgi:hypothetical protein
MVRRPCPSASGQRIRIDQGVTAAGVNDGYEPKGTGTVIAKGGGFNVGLAQEVLPGHVLAWGDEWISYNRMDAAPRLPSAALLGGRDQIADCHRHLSGPHSSGLSEVTRPSRGPDDAG